MDLLSLLTAFQCRVTGGYDYQWACFGPHSHGLEIGDDITIVFDRTNQTIYEVSFYYSLRDDDWDLHVLSWVHPDYRAAYLAERESRNIEDGEEFAETIEEVVQAAAMAA
jgi:hypothetical protein